MKIMDYFGQAIPRKKTLGDPLLEAYNDYLEIQLRIRELLQEVNESASIDFSGEKPHMNYKKTAFEDLTRFRKRRQEALDLFEKIDKFCETKLEVKYHSVSEYNYNCGDNSAGWLKLNSKIQEMVRRLKTKRPGNIPSALADGRKISGRDDLSDEQYLYFCMIGNVNVKRVYDQLIQQKKDIQKFEEKLPEFEEFVNKICGVKSDAAI